VAERLRTGDRVELIEGARRIGIESPAAGVVGTVSAGERPFVGYRGRRMVFVRWDGERRLTRYHPDLLRLVTASA